MGCQSVGWKEKKEEKKYWRENKGKENRNKEQDTLVLRDEGKWVNGWENGVGNGEEGNGTVAWWEGKGRR